MALTEQELKAQLQEIANNIQKVYKECNTVSQTAQSLYTKASEECFAALTEVQNAWNGGTAAQYIVKTNGKINDILSDCVDMNTAATNIWNKYLEYAKEKIKAMGLDPHAIMPDIF